MEKFLKHPENNQEKTPSGDESSGSESSQNKSNKKAKKPFRETVMGEQQRPGAVPNVTPGKQSGGETGPPKDPADPPIETADPPTEPTDPKDDVSMEGETKTAEGTANNEPPEGGRAGGARFADNQEYKQAAPKQKRLPYLIESKVATQAGQRAFELWKDHATKLCKNATELMGKTVKICTLEGKVPSRMPNELEYNWGEVKKYVHVHGDRQAFFREIEKGRVVVHITFCLFGKAKMDKEDIVTLNMNLLSTPETPPSK